MKNLVDEKPTDPLKGRLLQTVKLVRDKDIKNKIVLDVGCGYGWFEYNVLSRGVKRICGIEITKNDLKTIQKNLVDKRFESKVGSAIRVPYADNTFDTVVSWEVIEHIPKNTENKMFLEIYRVLKKGGIFYLSTPYDHLVSKFLDPAWWLIGHRHYSKDRLSVYAQKNGFVVEEIMPIGRWWRIASALNMYFSKWVLRRKPVFQNFFDLMDKKEIDKKNGYANVFARFRKI